MTQNKNQETSLRERIRELIIKGKQKGYTKREIIDMLIEHDLDETARILKL